MRPRALLAFAATGLGPMERHLCRVSLRAGGGDPEENLKRYFGSTRRRSRRERRRTIDFTREPSNAATKTTEREVSRIDALLDGASQKSRAEQVMDLLTTNVDGVTRLECLEEVLRLGRGDLVRSADVNWRDIITSVPPAKVTSFAAALCRAGLMDLVIEIAAKVWPSALADVDERSLDEDQGDDQDDDKRGVAARPGRFYSPVVCSYLRRGQGRLRNAKIPADSDDGLAIAALRSWRAAELSIRKDLAYEPVSVVPFNAALQQGHKARCLSAVFAVLDAMAAAGVQGDDDTFEVIGNTGARNVRFVTGAVDVPTLPDPGPFKEAVFIGRSNVGKSSLVNMITNRRAAAFVAKRPGKTQQFNYFEINGFEQNEKKKGASSKEETKSDDKKRKPPWRPRGQFYLVDVPGLGYAEVPAKARADWASFLEVYLKERNNIGVVFHLIDSRHGPTPVDRDIWTMLHRATEVRAADPDAPPLPFAIVLTKADKRSAKVALPTKSALRDELRTLFGDDAANNVPILVTSAETRRGRDAMWRYLRLAVEGDSPSSS